MQSLVPSQSSSLFVNGCGYIHCIWRHTGASAGPLLYCAASSQIMPIAGCRYKCHEFHKKKKEANSGKTLMIPKCELICCRVNFELVGDLVYELLAMLQLFRFIFWIPLKDLEPLSKDQHLLTGVLLGRTGHGRLSLASEASMLCSEEAFLLWQGGGGLRTALGLKKCILNLGTGGGGEAMMSVCLPLAVPIGLSPLHTLTLCGSDPGRPVLFDYSGVGCPRDGLLPMPLTRCIQMRNPSPCWVCRLQH